MKREAAQRPPTAVPFFDVWMKKEYDGTTEELQEVKVGCHMEVERIETYRSLRDANERAKKELLAAAGGTTEEARDVTYSVVEGKFKGSTEGVEEVEVEHGTNADGEDMFADEGEGMETIQENGDGSGARAEQEGATNAACIAENGSENSAEIQQVLSGNKAEKPAKESDNREGILKDGGENEGRMGKELIENGIRIDEEDGQSTRKETRKIKYEVMYFVLDGVISA